MCNDVCISTLWSQCVFVEEEDSDGDSDGDSEEDDDWDDDYDSEEGGAAVNDSICPEGQ